MSSRQSTPPSTRPRPHQRSPRFLHGHARNHRRRHTTRLRGPPGDRGTETAMEGPPPPRWRFECSHETTSSRSDFDSSHRSTHHPRTFPSHSSPPFARTRTRTRSLTLGLVKTVNSGKNALYNGGCRPTMGIGGRERSRSSFFPTTMTLSLSLWQHVARHLTRGARRRDAGGRLVQVAERRSRSRSRTWARQLGARKFKLLQRRRD